MITIMLEHEFDEELHTLVSNRALYVITRGYLETWLISGLDGSVILERDTAEDMDFDLACFGLGVPRLYHAEFDESLMDAVAKVVEHHHRFVDMEWCAGRVVEGLASNRVGIESGVDGL